MICGGSTPLSRRVAKGAFCWISGPGVLSLKIGLMTGEAIRGSQWAEERAGAIWRMACSAIQALVVNGQGKAVGEGDVVKGGPAPIPRRVAEAAVRWVSGSGMLSLEVGLMAGHAIVLVGRAVEGSRPVRRMAVRAIQALVVGGESEAIGEGVVVYGSPAPCRHLMTCQTGRGIPGSRVLLLEISLVTGQAVIRCRWIEERVAAVQGVTAGA